MGGKTADTGNSTEATRDGMGASSPVAAGGMGGGMGGMGASSPVASPLGIGFSPVAVGGMGGGMGGGGMGVSSPVAAGGMGGGMGGKVLGGEPTV